MTTRRLLGLLGAGLVALYYALVGVATIWVAFSRETIPEWFARISNGALSTGWPFLAVAVVLAVLLVMNARATTACPKTLPRASEKLYAKTFTNEAVEIDGKIFDRCTFDNVTFWYRGTGYTEFINGCALVGKGSYLRTTCKPAEVFLALMENFRSLAAVGGTSIEMINIDEHGNMTPAEPVKVTKP